VCLCWTTIGQKSIVWPPNTSHHTIQQSFVPRQEGAAERRPNTPWVRSVVINFSLGVETGARRRSAYHHCVGSNRGSFSRLLHCCVLSSLTRRPSGVAMFVGCRFNRAGSAVGATRSSKNGPDQEAGDGRGQGWRERVVRIIPEPSVSRIMVDDWLSLVGLVASGPWVRTAERRSENEPPLEPQRRRSAPRPNARRSPKRKRS
jgi:hypothetical protein